MNNKFAKKVVAVLLAVAMMFSVAAVSVASVSAASEQAEVAYTPAIQPLPDGTEIDLSNHVELKVGDQLLISKYSGTEVKIDGDSYTILRSK